MDDLLTRAAEIISGRVYEDDRVADPMHEEAGRSAAKAVFALIVERIENGLSVGAELAVERGHGEAQHAVEAYRNVVDMLDGEIA